MVALPSPLRPVPRHAPLLVALLLACASRAASAFGFDDVAELARQRAAQPYRASQLASDTPSLNYDNLRKIRFRPEHSLWRGSAFELQFFPANGTALPVVRLHEVVGGQARDIALSQDAFDRSDPTLPAFAKRGNEVAGVRVLGELNAPGRLDELIAFVGASYFRALGRGQVYGASARGVAVDTVGGAQGEEFPRFTDFWLERPAPQAHQLVVYALLDGPRVAGAYRFVLKAGPTTEVEVQARLYLRAPVATLGLAPLTSMFLAGENQPVATDFRPEVHDSDGLLVATGDGAWLWRPLLNPKSPFVTSFALESPRGFGLLQRDRNFASYEDLEAHYERRPSVWVQPLQPWGPGRIELLQFRTPDETHDNIAAYWVPEHLPAVGQPLNLHYVLHWQGEATMSPPLARVVQTRSGHGWRRADLPDTALQLHVDFAGAPLAEAAAVQAAVSANANVEGLRVHLIPNTERGGWRMTLDFLRRDPTKAVELRAELRDGDRVLSETWTYALPPE